jgi:hypothetical protein
VKSLADKTYLVQHKTLNGSSQSIKAATVEVHGKHLAFVSAEGKLAALFLLENVESWNVAPNGLGSRKPDIS